MALVEIPTPEQFAAMSKDELLTLQQRYNTELARLKLVESLFRLHTVQRFFGNELREGMNTYELGRGYELKVTHGYNYTLSETDKPKGDTPKKATTLALEAIAATGNEGAFIAGRLVKWKPELSITEYRNLSPEHKALLSPALTISDAAPKVELKVPV